MKEFRFKNTMFCVSCGKKTARFFFIEISSDGNIINACYCLDCVKKNPEIKAILDFFSKKTIRKKPVEKKKICSFCGISLREFKETGFAGCAMCYENFKQYIRKEIRKIHSHSFHRGKFPYPENDKKSFIDRLEAKMRDAVGRQDFKEIQKIRQQLELFLKHD